MPQANSCRTNAASPQDLVTTREAVACRAS